VALRPPTKKNKGHPVFPKLRGRSKVMVDPAMNQKLDIHGTIESLNKKKGQIHFDTDAAHRNE
jgi:hypothetical protein